MYINAIEKSKEYTSRLLIGVKRYNAKDIDVNIATMIKINNDGYFLTCRHVAELIQLYFNVQSEKEGLSKSLEQLNKILNRSERKKFEKLHNLNSNFVLDAHLVLPFEIKHDLEINIIMHEHLDLAIVKFNNIELKGLCPIFSNCISKQGMSICKLGFAFPNGNPFSYNSDENIIIYDNTNYFETPIFPFDGIVTRNINLNIGEHSFPNAAFETSTAGLRGQSGGPIFNVDGVVFGIQTMNFTIPLDIIAKDSNNREYSQFVNLGVGIASTEIIKFLKLNDVKCDIKEI